MLRGARVLLAVVICACALAGHGRADSGTLYYSANNSQDFNVYSLDIASPQDDPTVVATGPASVYHVAVDVSSDTLFFSAENSLFSCKLKDGVCDTSSPPEPIKTYSKSIVSLRMTKSGVLLMGEGKTIWYGKVGTDGSVEMAVLSEELSSARGLSSSQDTVVACCKEKEGSSPKEEFIFKLPLPTESKPLPRGGYRASDMELMWPVPATYIEATDAGTVWFIAQGSQNAIYSAYVESKGYQSVMSKDLTDMNSVCASGNLWGRPLFFHVFGKQIMQCQDAGCSRVDVWLDMGDNDVPYRAVAVPPKQYRQASEKLEAVYI